MSRPPSCPSCGCDMQFVAGGWRCPWTTSTRREKASVTVPGMGKLGAMLAPGVVCGWPSGSREPTTTQMLR